jgi:RimJ/RimL family protein N-acetyltransferase
MKKEVKTKTSKKKLAVLSSSPSKHEPVDPKIVKLVKGGGSHNRGDGPGGHYWHIQVADKRVGYVFINIITDDFFGTHPSIQIHINQLERGKQIGRVAYLLGCEQSGHEKVYAHMRKNNAASRRAAEEAGFKIIIKEHMPQLTMIWQNHAD